MKSMLFQVPYIACCLVGVLAIFHVQHYRLLEPGAPWSVPRIVRWWLYNALAIALAWEAIDAWKFGTPGWPASRWIIIPTLAVTLSWTAFADCRERRRRREMVGGDIAHKDFSPCD